MHVLMENRNGIGVDICVGEADGYAERTYGLKMLDRVKRKLNLAPTTLGADKDYDKGYDTEDFLPALEERGIEPGNLRSPDSGHGSWIRAKSYDIPRRDRTMMHRSSSAFCNRVSAALIDIGSLILSAKGAHLSGKSSDGCCNRSSLARITTKTWRTLTTCIA